MFCCVWLVFNSCDWHISIITVLIGCFLKDLLPCGSLVVGFLDCGHPYFPNFYSVISVDFVGVESYAVCQLLL